jgi:hypothetical protein
MSHHRDPRCRPRPEHGAWAVRETRLAGRVGAAAVAGAIGLLFGLVLACADVESTHARTKPTTERATSESPRANGAGASGTGAPRSIAPEDDVLPDLGLPTQRTLDEVERGAPLELDLPSRRVVRGPETAATERKAPTASAAPRSVERVRVTVHDQRLQLLAGREILREYRVSTARNGVGSQAGSQRTPLGRHRVHSKFGAGEPLGAVFEARRAIGKIATIHTTPVDLPEDVITTRILWLEGLEAGKNRGPGVDSHARFIYIHGTNEEGLIGQPASHGCVRMRNRDVAELFDLVAPGTLVEILE